MTGRGPDRGGGRSAGAAAGGRRTAIVGAGIVGLACAQAVLDAHPDDEVVVLEKEAGVARHQTGHNSGVVHAGLYYVPGSLKAQLCRRGVGLLRDFCGRWGIDYRECGKVVVATDARELGRLDEVQRRALANGVPGIRRLDARELREIEPHVRGIAALHSPTTAIVDYTSVAEALREQITARGGHVEVGAEVDGVHQTAGGVELSCASGEAIRADRVLVCAGLQVDRLARRSGRSADPRIIPFRGDFYALREEARALVGGLIYPVPDPAMPFLGVHLTRRIDGGVLIGPNAVLSLDREGYRRTAFDRSDAREIVTWPGMGRLALRHWRTGMTELAGAASRRRFVTRARRYVPELTVDDVVAASPGIRAQAVDRRGALVDDFVLDHDRRVVWVRNAPSPAATSALAIAEHIVARLPS